MALARDFYGFRYDDAVPAFVNVSAKFLIHTPRKMLMDAPSVAAAMTAASYTPAAGEMGDAVDWVKEHFGIEVVAGGPPVVAPTPSTAATAGAPGSFDHDVPATLAALQALGALGSTTAWTGGQYVTLGDGSEAHWDGTKWAVGKVPLATAVATVTLAGKGTATVTVTIGGAGAPGGATAGQINVTGLTGDGKTIAGIGAVPITKGDTTDDIATHLAAELDGKQDGATSATIHAVAAGSIVTITETDAGGNVDYTGIVVA